MESRTTEGNPEVTEHSAELNLASVIGKRGKKAESTAPLAPGQITRSRNAKSQERNPSEQHEILLEKIATTLCQITTEAVSEQTNMDERRALG